MDSSGSSMTFLLLIILGLAGAYFAAAETAYASLNKIRIKKYADDGDSRARRAMKIAGDFDRALITMLIGTNVTHIAFASLVTVLATRLWGTGSVAWTTVASTVFVFLFVEMLPKSFAKKYSLRLALGTASSLVFFMHLLTPVSFVLTKIGEFASRLTKGDSEVSVTEDDF